MGLPAQLGDDEDRRRGDEDNGESIVEIEAMEERALEEELLNCHVQDAKENPIQEMLKTDSTHRDPSKFFDVKYLVYNFDVDELLFEL